MAESSSENIVEAQQHSTWPAILVVVMSLFPLGLFTFALLGRYFFLAELVGNFRAQILFMLIPFPILLFWLGRWKWGMVMAVASAWATIGVLSIFLPGFQPESGPKQLKIMSFNVLGDNQQLSAVIHRIREEDPDLLTIVEYSNHWPEVLEQLDGRYPYRVLEPRWHGFGIAVFSKYPLENTKVHLLTQKATDIPSIETRVKFGNQSVRILGLHVMSPTNIFRMRLRNEQLAEMAQILVVNNEPTIVLGDFNCTPWSPFLSDFLRTTGYRDSRQGFGYQPSWHTGAWPLMIPIDHAFVSEQIRIHDRYLGKPAGSDHLPLVFRISVSESAGTR